MKARCGSCLNLEKDKAVDKPSSCIKLGKIPTSKKCASYVPNMHSLINTENKANALFQIANLMCDWNNYELEAFGNLLHTIKTTKRNGWKFCEIVYVRYTGTASSNYLSNFMSCRVIYADKNYVKVVSNSVTSSGSALLTLINDKESKTIFRVKEFAKLRKEMRNEGKFVDPNEKKVAIILDKRRCPSMDEVLRQDKMSDNIRKSIEPLRNFEHGRIIGRILKGKTGKSNDKNRKTIEVKEIVI